jgi:hypothetical protein
MSNTPVGVLLSGEAGRDAIHVAIAPVIATERLHPGDRIRFVEGSTERVEIAAAKASALGIVDPFLSRPVYEGDRFWMFLLPNTITGLSHVWTHPAFDGTATPAAVMELAVAKTRIAEIAEALNLTYDALMEAANLWVDEEDYAVQYGSETWRDRFPQHLEAFWEAYEVVTGTKVEDREQFFSCSC